MRAFVISLLLLFGVPSAALAAPILHAHRGGSIREGVPTAPEDTLEAFADTARTPDVWLEMDTLVTKDGVPVVIHDSTLDRVTDCTGNVVEKTAAQLAKCRVDVLGASANLKPAPASSPRVGIPLLADVLALAKRTGAPVNLEIKRIPGDPGYVLNDTTFAKRVMRVVKAAKLPKAKLIMQSFDPTNLDVAKKELPGVQTSLLTLMAQNDVAVGLATSRGYDWVSPGGVPSPMFMAQARAAGLKVVPYTLDTVEDVRAAAAAGVDALITDDLPLARRALGLPAGPKPLSPAARSKAAQPRAEVAVSGVPRSPRQVAKRGLAVVLRASRATRARVTVRYAGRTVARRTVAFRTAGTRRATLKLSSPARRSLRGKSSAKLVVSVKVDGRPGGRTVVRLR